MRQPERENAMVPASIPTSVELPGLVSALQQRGYTGLMVILARTADAGAQLRELTDEWTSLHDVTGQRIAVVCPTPRTQTPSVEPISPTPYFHGLAEAPRTPREHHLAWTEATSRCATYFGIPEAELPSVLVLSFDERTGVLAQSA